MKKTALITLAFVASILGGCGHGYEGEYVAQTGSSNELINALAKTVESVGGEEKIVIGPNFIDSNGQRTEFDEIFVRHSGSDAYLVLKDKKSEEVWKIVDKDTLIKGSGLFSVTLKRKKQ